VKSIKYANLFPVLASYLLGCITYYVFLCFNGVVLAHSSKLEVLILRTLFRLVSHDKNSKILIFNIVSNLETTFVNLLVVFLFSYLITNYIAKNTVVNSLAVTLGAVTIDLYYLRTMPFGESYFFSENFEVNFISLTVWFICAVASIKISYFCKSKDAARQLQIR
jgi:hypothetical protein